MSRGSGLGSCSTDLELCELHFEVDAPIGSVWAELRCADGSLVERLSASEAMALACGDAVAGLALAA